MNGSRTLTAIDKLVCHLDRAVRTLHGDIQKPQRPSPANHTAQTYDKAQLDLSQRKHAAGLMRVNHTGEVCAQALYSGQSLTSRDKKVEREMLESAREEEDHLAWCEERLHELGARPSMLNPLFYAGSFTMGAIAGLVSDKFSLGFIAATEDRVCQHLNDHLNQLPDNDKKSRAVVSQMIKDETAHGQKALDAGGQVFSEAQKNAMAAISKFMTQTSYHI